MKCLSKKTCAWLEGYLAIDEPDINGSLLSQEKYESSCRRVLEEVL